MGTLGEPSAQEGGDDAAGQGISPKDQPHGGRTMPEGDLVVNQGLLQRDGGAVDLHGFG